MQLEEYFFKQLETRRKQDGRSCPGEEICAHTGPLRDKSRPIEEICSACPLLPTKPGNIPSHLAMAVIAALRLDRLQEGGSTFAYPDALSPVEWAALSRFRSTIGPD